MQIIPAIDIKNSKCVRLVRGQMDKAEVFYDKPHEAALMWQDQGASRLHVVDLDGAIKGKPINFKTIKEIVKAVDIPVQIGGGIRDLNTLSRYFDAGIDRIILGTSVVSDRVFFEAALDRFKELIIVGIDALNGMVSVKGWVEESDVTAMDLAKEVELMGASRIIYTDIDRDGTLIGPNLKGLRMMAESINIKLIASGGVSCLDDVRDIINLGFHNIEGIIVGKALYNGNLRLKDTLSIGDVKNVNKTNNTMP
jgi:phosphoribosylformimino-5-aminoimidazole carboxamide ribotide isomerase